MFVHRAALPAQSDPVVVIGAGFAGLVAARELARRAIPYIVLEAGAQVGGLAGSRALGAFTHDLGAHFITNRLARNLGLARECRVVRSWGESVRLDGRWYSHPFGLARVPGAARELPRAVARSLFTERPARSAADVVRARYGATLAERVVLPLLEAWSGAAAADLAPAAVRRLPASLAATTVLQSLRALTGLPIAAEYCRERAAHPLLWHVYPSRGGIATISAGLAREVEPCVRRSSPVLAIRTDGDRVLSVTTRDDDIRVRGVVSTMPVTQLAHVVRGMPALEPLRGFAYRKLAVVHVRLRGRGVLPTLVGWFPERRFPFFRITEVPLAAPWTIDDASTVLTIDHGVAGAPADRRASDADLVAASLAALAELAPDIASRFVDSSVTRIDLGYPVFLNAYEPVRRDLVRLLAIPGLCSVGRNGEFDHLLMEDVYWRTLRQIDRFCAEAPVAKR